jgi:hypothetical protein
MPRLENLIADRTILTDTNFDILTNKCKSQIKILNIQDNKELTYKTYGSIAKTFTCLQNLNVESNVMGYDDVKALLTPFTKSTGRNPAKKRRSWTSIPDYILPQFLRSLSTLNLSKNKIGDAAASLVSILVKYSTSLQVL